MSFEELSPDISSTYFFKVPGENYQLTTNSIPTALNYMSFYGYKEYILQKLFLTFQTTTRRYLNFFFPRTAFFQ
jgi:hypothetical protein